MSLRVLEAGRDLAPAYAGWLLAGLGAEVVRLEGGEERSDPVGLARQAFAQGKPIRPSTPAALDGVDLVLTDDEPALAALAGRSLEALVAERPRLVVGVASIFGRTGPLAGLPATELDAQALSGTCFVLGEAGREPLSLPPGVLACQAGAHLAAASLAALVGRGGTGRIVDVALADVLAHYVGVNCRFYVHHGMPFRRAGRRASASGGAYPFVILPCADGDVCLSGRTRPEWERFVAAMGAPAWSQEPRYQALRAMGQSYPDEVDALVMEWLKDKTKAEIEALANERKLTIAPLRTFAEILATPQYAERRFFRPASVAGRDVLAPTPPFKMTAARDPDAADLAPACLAHLAPPGLEERPAPLAGLRVVDLGWVWSAPQAGSILAQLGADVIKVEHGARLDNTRLSGRVIRNGEKVDGPTTEMSPMFHQINLGKRGVALNLKEPEAVELLMKLVAESDVVIENMSPGSLERSGLGYEAFRAVNPRVVMLSMSGAGQFGPLADMRTYAPAMSSFAGMESLVGYPGERPVGALNFALGDPNAAVHGLVALLAALLRREATGAGCYIDLSQTEALLATLAPYLLQAQVEGAQPAPMGNRDPRLAPHGVYPAAGEDRWLAISADDAQWPALRETIGESWAREPRFATAEGRLAHQAELDRALAAWTARQDRDALVARLRAAGVASSPVRPIEEVWTDPHLRARGMLVPVELPVLGPEPMFRAPWLFSDFTPQVRSRGPALGEHDAEVFEGLLGVPPAEFERLRASGAIS